MFNAESRSLTVNTVSPTGKACPWLTWSQNSTMGAAPGFPRVKLASVPRRQGKVRLKTWNRQEKSRSASVTLAPGPKFGVGTAAMPSKLGLVVQSTVIESPLPSGLEASICRSGLPPGNAGGSLS